MPCDEKGTFLPSGSLPSSRQEERAADDWFPYGDRLEFELADFLFRNMPKNKTNHLLELLMAMARKNSGGDPPFTTYQELLSKIDAIEVGDVSWQSFQVQYPQDELTHESPAWMRMSFDVHYRDPLEIVKHILDNRELQDQFDYVPYLNHDAHGHRVWKDFMSGNWAWKQAVSICASQCMHVY